VETGEATGLSASQQELKVDPFVGEVRHGTDPTIVRSVRLNGFATCLRLEQVYWNILGNMAAIAVRSARCCPTWIAKCICATAG
jgi:hypothetical protein